MRKFYLSLFACLFILSCSTNTPKLSPKQIAFNKLIARQKLVDLPIHFNLNSISDSSTQALIENDSDTLIIDPNSVSGRIMGLYKDTTNYFLFINLYAAAQYIPTITIFDKQGNKISDESLTVEGCNFDYSCFCSSIANIFKENGSLQFYAHDSVAVFANDSLTNQISKRFIKFKKGIINTNGTITVQKGERNF